MSEVQPPYFLQGGVIQHNARGFRRLLGGFISEGVARLNGSDDMKVTTVSGGTSPVVSIARGGCYVQGDEIVDQGLYFVYNDSAKQITLNPRPASGSRTDMIIARVRDASEGNAGDTWLLDKITGSLTLPASACKLAEITVPASGDLTIDDTKRTKSGVTSLGATLVNTDNIQDGAITEALISDGAVTGRKMNPNIGRQTLAVSTAIGSPGTATPLITLNVTTPVANARCLVWGVLDWSCAVGAELYAYLTVDNVAKPERAIIDISDGAVRGTTGQCWLVTGLAAGTHQLQLVATHALGSGSQAIALNTTLTSWMFAG